MEHNNIVKSIKLHDDGRLTERVYFGNGRKIELPINPDGTIKWYEDQPRGHLYYAGYKSIHTDIAIFLSLNQQIAWLKSWSIFDRVPYSEEEALRIIGNNFVYFTDEDDIIWMINPCNIYIA